MVMTAGARQCIVLLQQLVAFHLPQTTLQLHKNIKYEGLRTLLDWFFGLFKKHRQPFKILDDCPCYTVTLVVVELRLSEGVKKF